MSYFSWKEKIAVKRLILNDERATFHFRLEHIEKRKSEILKHVLGWSSLKSAVGVGGAAILSNATVLVVTLGLVAVVVASGLYLYRNADYDGKRAEAEFATVRAPLLAQLKLLERQVGVRLRITVP